MRYHSSNAFSTNAAGQLNVLRHDCDSFSVDGAQICVFEEANHVGFSCFLESEYGLRLKSEVRLVFLRDLTDETLEGQLSNKELS